MYPDVKIKTRRMMLLSRIYLFVAIVAEAVLVAVNHYGDFETAWSLVTGLIFFYGYLVVRFAILGKTGYIAKTIVLTLIAILILIAIDFVSGYRGWSNVKILGMDFLTFFDFLSNSIIMPIVALCTCILIGWVIKPKTIADEVTRNGERFSRRALFDVMIKYIAPICLVFILISYTLAQFGIISL